MNYFKYYVFKWINFFFIYLILFLLITIVKCDFSFDFNNQFETTAKFSAEQQTTSFLLNFTNNEIDNIENDSNTLDFTQTTIIETNYETSLFFSANLSLYSTSAFSSLLDMNESNNESQLATLSTKSSLKIGDVIINTILSVIFFTIIVFTLVGNLLVILAVVIVRKLHTEDNANNFLIVNLAISDFLVGVLVMPFAFYVELSENNNWNLGAIVCDLWTVSDTLLCTASILNLCAISVDRYCIILHAMVYTQRRNAKLMLIMILVVWVLSAIISIPPLLGWGKPSARLEKDQLCAYSSDLKYQIYATLFAFYLPSSIMIIIYITIYRAAKKIKKRESETAALQSFQSNQSHSLSYSPDSQLNFKSQLEPLISNNTNNNSEHKLMHQSSIYDYKSKTSAASIYSVPVNNSISNGISANNKHRSNKNKLSKNSTHQQQLVAELKAGSESEDGSIESKIYHSLVSSQENGSSTNVRDNINNAPIMMVVTSTNQPGINSSNVNLAIGGPNRRSSLGKKFSRRFTQVFGMKRNSNASTRRNQKATRTLGVIMGCFILCWLPFFIVAIIKPIKLDGGYIVGDYIPKWFDSFLLWLGYVNSALNPIIYVRFNREFRFPFIEILFFRCRGINRKLREEERRKAFYENSSYPNFNVIANNNNARNSVSQYSRRMNININETDELGFNQTEFNNEEMSKVTNDNANNETNVNLKEETLKIIEEITKLNNNAEYSPNNSAKKSPKFKNVSLEPNSNLKTSIKSTKTSESNSPNLNRSCLKRQSKMLSDSSLDDVNTKIPEFFHLDSIIEDKAASIDDLHAKQNFPLEKSNQNNCVTHSNSFGTNSNGIHDSSNYSTPAQLASPTKTTTQENLNSSSKLDKNSRKSSTTTSVSNQSSIFYASTTSIFDQLEKSVSSMSSQATQRYQPSDEALLKKSFFHFKEEIPPKNNRLKNIKNNSSSNSIPFSSVYSFITAPTSPVSTITSNLNTVNNDDYLNRYNLKEDEEIDDDDDEDSNSDFEEEEEDENLNEPKLSNNSFYSTQLKNRPVKSPTNKQANIPLAYCTYNKKSATNKKFSSITVNSSLTKKNDFITKFNDNLNVEAEQIIENSTIFTNIDDLTNDNLIERNNDLCKLSDNINSSVQKIKPGSLVVIKNASETSV